MLRLGRFGGVGSRVASASVLQCTVGARPGVLYRNLDFKRFNSTQTIEPVAAAIQTEILPIATSPISETIQKISETVSTVSPDHIGYFQSVGLAQSWTWPPGLFQHVFEYVHVGTGLPWWGTIILVTIGLRALMLPMYMKSSNATAKMTQIKPELNRLMKEYNESDDPIAAQKTLLERRKLMQKYNIKTSHMMLPMLSIPFFIGIFGALNGMSKVPVHGMLTEGALWFQNLAAPDPYLGLQIITATFYALTFKLGGETGANTMSPAMKKVFTWMPFVAVPMTMSLPAGVCMYFALNGIISVGQTYLMQSKTFRNYMNLAPIVKPPVEETENVGVMETLKQSFDKAKQRAEKAAREAEREARLKREKEQEDQSRFVQFTGKNKKK
jgi:YidC/Oxa1 family membrane protein insertase